MFTKEASILEERRKGKVLECFLSPDSFFVWPLREGFIGSLCFWTSHFHALEKAMAPHSSTLAWKIPWTEEPGGLQSMGSLRVRHDWATSLSLFTSMHWRRKWQPTPGFLPGESQGCGGAWWAAVYGVAQSQTRLKRLSSRSSHAFGRICVNESWNQAQLCRHHLINRSKPEGWRSCLHEEPQCLHAKLLPSCPTLRRYGL